MKSDLNKSKQALIEDLNVLRQQAAKADELQKRLADLEKSYINFQNKYEKRTKEFKEECFCRDNTEEALRMAEVIVRPEPGHPFSAQSG